MLPHSIIQSTLNACKYCTCSHMHTHNLYLHRSLNRIEYSHMVLKLYLSQMRIVRDNVKCPCMGRNFFVNSPMMTSRVHGWGVVGHNIDRHIISEDLFGYIPGISTTIMRPRNSSRDRCVRSKQTRKTSPEVLIYRPSEKRY